MRFRYVESMFKVLMLINGRIINSHFLVCTSTFFLFIKSPPTFSLNKRNRLLKYLLCNCNINIIGKYWKIKSSNRNKTKVTDVSTSNMQPLLWGFSPCIYLILYIRRHSIDTSLKHIFPFSGQFHMPIVLFHVNILMDSFIYLNAYYWIFVISNFY